MLTCRSEREGCGCYISPGNGGEGGGMLTCRSEREGCGCYTSPGNGGEGEGR